MIAVGRLRAPLLDDSQLDLFAAARRVLNRQVERLARIEAAHDHFQSAALEGRELEQIADETEQLLAGALHLTERVLLLVRNWPGEPLLHERDVAYHRG